MRHKLKEWVKRYLPVEIAGTLTALAGASLVHLFTNNGAATAYAGTWGENIGFYGAAAFREVYIYYHKYRGTKGNLFIIFWKTLRNLVLEFGPAELFDSFLSRPFWMYLFPKIIGHFTLGIILGKLTADLFSYSVTIIAYELKKKHIKD